MQRSLLKLTSQLPLIQSQCHKSTKLWSPKGLALVTQIFKKGAPEPMGLPDSLEHATGPLKAELQMAEMGILDPWLATPVDKHNAGKSKDDPHIVCILKGHNKRTVACHCEPDQTYFCYMNIEPGELTRCECGLWLKGVEVPHPHEYVNQFI